MLDGEANLIYAAVGGEAEAFGLLYDHYQPSIYRFVFIKVGYREEAEDLTHQVFISAWQNISTYKHQGFPFSSWLYQIARNQVIDYYRTKKFHSPLEDIDPEHFAESQTITFTFDDGLRLKQVREALQKLKPEYQDVIIMRFVEELSIKETAHALKKSEGAVKLLQHRALHELRKKLAS